MYLVKIDNDKNIITSINDDEINWDNISSHRIMSNEFIEEYKDRINWDIFIDNNILTYDIVENYIKYLYPYFNKLISTDNYINQDEKEKVKSLLFRCNSLIDLDILELYGEKCKNIGLEIKEIEYGLCDRSNKLILVRPYILFSYDEDKYDKFKMILDLTNKEDKYKLDIINKNGDLFIFFHLNKKYDYDRGICIPLDIKYILSRLYYLLK